MPCERGVGRCQTSYHQDKETCKGCVSNRPTEAPNSADPLGSTVAAGYEDAPQPVNQGHFHEIIDRTHIICCMIDDLLIDHPGMTKKMNSDCEVAQRMLNNLAGDACDESDKLETEELFRDS